MNAQRGEGRGEAATIALGARRRGRTGRTRLPKWQVASQNADTADDESVSQRTEQRILCIRAGTVGQDDGSIASGGAMEDATHRRIALDDEWLVYTPRRFGH